jgi:hypothetical protein
VKKEEKKGKKKQRKMTTNAQLERLREQIHTEQRRRNIASSRTSLPIAAINCLRSMSSM